MRPRPLIRSRSRRGRLLLPVLATLAATALAGCAGAAAPTSDRGAGPAAVVHGHDADGLSGTRVDDPPLRVAPVTLRDTGGRPVDLADTPAGRVTVLFFGFTHCDDVCPTTMADLAAARRALPEALAGRVDLRFVTVDPRRDTPAVLRRWLDRFGTDVAGLRGPTALVDRAERSLYADTSSTTAPTPDPAPTGTTGAPGTPRTPGTPQGESGHDESSGSDHDEVSHSGSVYVFGPRGETVLYTGGTTPTQYAADLTRLLRRS